MAKKQIDLGPTLETERLLLRPPQAEDFEAWAEFMGDGDHVRFVGGAQPPPMAWRAMMSVAGAWALEGFGFFSVIEKSTGAWVGRLGPWQPHGWPGTEVGWGIVRSAGGKGYATEGSIATIDWAFDHLGWTEVIHTIDPANVSSKRVAERLGSRYLHMTRPPPPFDHTEVEVWGQSREEWFARRGRA